MMWHINQSRGAAQAVTTLANEIHGVAIFGDVTTIRLSRGALGEDKPVDRSSRGNSCSRDGSGVTLVVLSQGSGR